MAGSEDEAREPIDIECWLVLFLCSPESSLLWINALLEEVGQALLQRHEAYVRRYEVCPMEFMRMPGIFNICGTGTALHEHPTSSRYCTRPRRF